jgi:hypothetical protein
MPAELANDVLGLDEPLPDADGVAGIITRIHSDAGIELAPDILQRAIAAVSGIPSFPIEQTIAMSLTRNGLDVDQTWERKRRTIESTPGLSVYRGTENIADCAGYENAMQFIARVGRGRKRPRAIVFLDEIEKSTAGQGSNELDPVGADQLRTFLAEMQDMDATGAIAVGPPGSGKSLWAKIAGNALGIPTIVMDIGGMRGSLQGQSEQAIRNCFKVARAIAENQLLFIATSNKVANLRPELRRRFRLGTFFFDLPSPIEALAIWALYLRKYELAEQPLPAHAGWTGAEIRQCCDNAWRYDMSLLDAAELITPVCQSAADEIERLRREASGKYISANYPGKYQYQNVAAPAPGSVTRKLEFN